MIDNHINSFLYNYFEKPHNKIIYVTSMEPDYILKSHSFSASNNAILRLAAFFNDPIASVRPGAPNIDHWKAHLEQLCNSVSVRGYGKLTKNVVLYANGSEKFFQDGDPEAMLTTVE